MVFIGSGGVDGAATSCYNGAEPGAHGARLAGAARRGRVPRVFFDVFLFSFEEFQMFDKIMSQATTGKTKKASKAKAPLPRTQAFVEALDKAGLRISYASIALASEALGERTVSGLSDGQRGSQVVAHLPIELQPNVCRANGRYKKGTTWGEREPDAELIGRGFVKPATVMTFLNTFLEATEGSTAVAETEEAVAEVADEVVEDLEFETVAEVVVEESSPLSEEEQAEADALAEIEAEIAAEEIDGSDD